MDDIKITKNNNNDVDDILIVNNIEVVYSHVILVLKGVSLKVKKGWYNCITWW
jgi:branched-chain amino acid transport system ATP-binding protein